MEDEITFFQAGFSPAYAEYLKPPKTRKRVKTMSKDITNEPEHNKLLQFKTPIEKSIK